MKVYFAGSIRGGEPDREWAGSRFALEDENVAVGLLNDGEYIYLSLETRDRRLGMQLLGMGFTVWFDPDGGDDKVLGVEFPLEGRTGMRGMRGMEPGMERSSEPPDPEEFRKHLEESIASMDEFVIHGPRKDEIHPRVIDEGKGVEVRIAPAGGGLVYELKVPLAITTEHPYAIGTRPGDVIGVGLETAEMDMSAMRDKMGGRGMGGGMGGRPGGGMGGGRGGGMGGGPMGGGRPEMPEPLKVWAKVQLAGSAEMNDNDVAVIEIDEHGD